LGFSACLWILVSLLMSVGRKFLECSDAGRVKVSQGPAFSVLLKCIWPVGEMSLLPTRSLSVGIESVKSGSSLFSDSLLCRCFMG
jgi:hypothetical protein